MISPLARSPLCYAFPSLRSVAPLPRSPLCYARSSPPPRSPLALLGGRFGGAGLPRRFAPPPPRRVALPLWGLLPRPAPLRLAPWRPLSLRGLRVSPRAPPVPRGHPRPCARRGVPPPLAAPPLLGASRPLSPSLSAVGVRLRPTRHAPTHTPCPLAHPEGVFNRLGRFLSATAYPSATDRHDVSCRVLRFPRPSSLRPRSVATELRGAPPPRE